MPNANILFQNQPTAPLSAHFNDAMNTAQNFNQFQQMPVKNRLLEAHAQSAELGVKGAELNQESAQFQLDRKQQLAQVADMAADAYELIPIIQGGDQFQLFDKLQSRVEKITARGGDPSDTIEFMSRLKNGEISQEQAISELGSVVGTAQQLGVFGNPQTAAIRDFEAKAKAAGLEKGTPEYIKAAKVDLGIAPRESLSAEERIALDERLGKKVTDQKANEAGAEEGAKLNARLAIKPKIAAAVKQAETVAKERGETLSAYERAKASLPGLKEVIGKLKSISDIATYTMGGKAFDSVVKELGFGSTEGSTARAKLTSLVDNQVLPLLRDTFGAAFTAAEGDRLRNAMVDPDSSPEAKKATLDSFLEQKMRDLETKENELGISAQPAGPTTATSKSGIQFTVE